MCEDRKCINCKYMRTSYSDEPCKSCDRHCRSNWVDALTRGTTFNTTTCIFKTGDIVAAKTERSSIKGLKNIYIYLCDNWVLRIPYYVDVNSSYILSMSYRQRKYTIDKLIADDIAAWISIDDLEYASTDFIEEHNHRARLYYVTETLNDWFNYLINKEPEKKPVTKITVHHMGEVRYDKYPTLNANFIKRVIFSDPATIVFWEDGTKTVVKTQDGEKYDKEKGLAMAISKMVFGNERDYYNVFKRWMRKGEERHEET